MHVYLPSTLDDLAAALASGEAAADGSTAYAVTPAVRAALPDGNDEELEYLAQHYAAHASLDRLTGAPNAARRRVVVVLDVAESVVDDADGLEDGAVTLRAAVPTARIVSALVDDPAAEDAVTALLATPDDPALAEDLEDHALLWFATQELADL